MLKVGCCGFPRARAVYYRRFPVVEVQQTFYQPPRVRTLERWRAEAPLSFEFTVKAWQVITHPAASPTYRRMREPLARPEEAGYFRPGDAVLAAWERTRRAARALAARFVLFQSPASFTPSKEHVANLRRFFRKVPRDGLVLAWEPRGGWEDALVAKLCEEQDLLHCVDPFKERPAYGPTAYFRLHGVAGYGYRYTDEDLKALLGLLADFDDAYCLFNNRSMWDDAERFLVMAASKRRPLRPAR